MLRKIFSFILSMIILVFFVSLGFAGESDVLPKNVWRVRTYFQSSSTTQKYNKDGDKIELVPDSDGLYPLSPLAPYLGASHVYGTITGDGKLSASATAFVVEYGFTDQITGQILIPVVLKAKLDYGFGWQDNSADDAALAALGQPADPLGAALLAGTKSLYPDTSGSGVGDIETGLQYKFYKTKQVELAVAGGFRLPTGKKDDPDKADDFATGDGQLDLGAHIYGDWHFTEIISVGGYVKYEPQLEATYDKASAIGGTYKKNLGDLVKTWVSVYADNIWMKGFEAKLGFGGDFKGKDEIDGTEVADSETAYYYVKPYVEYTCMTTKIPFRLLAEYKIPTGGKNTPALQTVQIGGQIFLKF